MAKQVFFLNERQDRLIQELVDAKRKTRLTSPLRDPEPKQGGQTSDTYVAYPKTTDGIPAMDGVTPGVAECDIYRLVEGDTATLETMNETRMVYNISGNKIDQSWILVDRLKSGQWVVIPTATSAPLMLFKTNAEQIVWDEEGLTAPYLNARPIIFNPETQEYDFLSEDEAVKITAYWPQCPQNESGQYIQCGCGWSGLRIWCKLTYLADESLRWEIVDGLSWNGVINLQGPWVFPAEGTDLPYATAKAYYNDPSGNQVYSPQTFKVYNPTCPKTSENKWVGLPYGGTGERYTVCLNDSGYYEVTSPQRVQAVFKLNGYWEYSSDSVAGYTPWGNANLYRFNGTNYVAVTGGGYIATTKVYWQGALTKGGTWANLPKGAANGIWGIALWCPYPDCWEVQTVFQPDSCYRGTMKSDWSKSANPVKITLVEEGFDIDAVGWGYPSGTTLKAGDEVIVDYMGDEGQFYFHSDTGGAGATLFQLTGEGTVASGFNPTTAIAQKLVWNTASSKYALVPDVTYTLHFVSDLIANNGPGAGKYIEWGIPGSRRTENIRVWATNVPDSNGDDRWEVVSTPRESVQVKLTGAWAIDTTHKLAYAQSKLWYFDTSAAEWVASTVPITAFWDNIPVDSDGNPFAIPADETGKILTVHREGLGLYSVQKDSITCVFKMYDSWVASGNYFQCYAFLYSFNGTNWISTGKKVKLNSAACLVGSGGSQIALPKGGASMTMGTCRWDGKSPNWEVISVFNPQQLFRATLTTQWTGGTATINVLPGGPMGINATGWGYPTGTKVEAGTNVTAMFMQDEGTFYFFSDTAVTSVVPAVLLEDCTTPAPANIELYGGYQIRATSWGYPAGTVLKAGVQVLAYYWKDGDAWYFGSSTSGTTVRRALTAATWTAGTTGAISVVFQDSIGGSAQATGWGYKTGTIVENGSYVWVASLPTDNNALYFWSAVGATVALYQATSDGVSASGQNPSTVTAKPLKWNPANGGSYVVDNAAQSVNLYHPLGPRVPDGTSFINLGISKAGERFWASPVPGTDGSVRLEIVSGHNNLFLVKTTEAWYTSGTAGRVCKAHILHYINGAWQESYDYIYIYNSLHPKIDGAWASVPVGVAGDYYLVRESWSGRDSYSNVYEVVSTVLRPRFFFTEKNLGMTRNYPASAANPVSYTAKIYEINAGGPNPVYSTYFEASVHSFIEPLKSTGGYYKVKGGTTGICYFDYASSKFFVECYTDPREMFKAQVAANWDNTEMAGGTLKVTLPPDTAQHDCVASDFEVFLAEETTITVRHTFEGKLEAVVSPAFNTTLLTPDNPKMQELEVLFYKRKISGVGNLVTANQPSYENTASIALSTCPSTTSSAEVPAAVPQAGVLQDLWYSGFVGPSEVVQGTDVETGTPVEAVAYGYEASGAVLLPGTPVVLFEVATAQWVFMPTLTGTWTMTLNGIVSASLNYNATASEVNEALQPLTGYSGMTAVGLVDGGFPNEGGGYRIVIPSILNIYTTVVINYYFSGVVPGYALAMENILVADPYSSIIDLLGGTSGTIALNGGSHISIGTSGTDIASLLTTQFGYLVTCYQEGSLGTSPIGIQFTGAPNPYEVTGLVETYNDTGHTLEITNVKPNEVQDILLHYIPSTGTGTGTGTGT